MTDLKKAVLAGREAFTTAPLGISAVEFAIRTAAPIIEAGVLAGAVQDFDDVWCEWHGHLGSSWTCDFIARPPDDATEAYPVRVYVMRKEEST
jgi:hypothetical protein